MAIAEDVPRTMCVVMACTIVSEWPIQPIGGPPDIQTLDNSLKAEFVRC